MGLTQRGQTLNGDRQMIAFPQFLKIDRKDKGDFGGEGQRLGDPLQYSRKWRSPQVGNEIHFAADYQ
jgi:hypothetical protein